MLPGDLYNFDAEHNIMRAFKGVSKNRINDSEMALSNRKVEKNELNFQSYREAASGANAGKTGGGCGCN